MLACLQTFYFTSIEPNGDTTYLFHKEDRPNLALHADLPGPARTTSLGRLKGGL